MYKDLFLLAIGLRHKPEECFSTVTFYSQHFLRFVFAFLTYKRFLLGNNPGQ